MTGRRSFLVITLALLVSACGFHLKGYYEVPEPLRRLVLSEQSTQPSALTTELVRQLTQNDISVVDQAPYRLDLGEASYRRRALSLSGQAEALEFELGGQVEFRLYQQDSDAPVLERTVSVERSYSNIEDNAIALESLEARYRNEINRALAEQILRQYLSFAPAN